MVGWLNLWTLGHWETVMFLVFSCDWEDGSLMIRFGGSYQVQKFGTVGALTITIIILRCIEGTVPYIMHLEGKVQSNGNYLSPKVR